MSPQRRAAKPAKSKSQSKSRPKSQPSSSANGGSPYGYAFTAWLAREDPEFMQARAPLSTLSFGEGKELSIKYKEMVIVGILAFRGNENGCVAHMRRAIEHGATRRELLEAIQAAAVPGGGPTLSTGVQALMELEKAGLI